MIVLGVDPSATAIGCAWTDAGVVQALTIRSSLRGGDRLAANGHAFGELLDRVRPDLVVIEGYGFASQTLAAQAEMVGVLKAELAEREILLAPRVPPSSLKKAITGDGRASKTKMQRTVQRMLRAVGSDLVLQSDHEADATGLMWLGMDAVGVDGVPEFEEESKAVDGMRAWGAEAARIIEALKRSNPNENVH